MRVIAGTSGTPPHLLASFGDTRSLASGSLLLAELALGRYRRHTGETMDACVRDLCQQLESSVRGT